MGVWVAVTLQDPREVMARVNAMMACKSAQVQKPESTRDETDETVDMILARVAYMAASTQEPESEACACE